MPLLVFPPRPGGAHSSRTLAGGACAGGVRGLCGRCAAPGGAGLAGGARLPRALIVPFASAGSRARCARRCATGPEGRPWTRPPLAGAGSYEEDGARSGNGGTGLVPGRAVMVDRVPAAFWGLCDGGAPVFRAAGWRGGAVRGARAGAHAGAGGRVASGQVRGSAAGRVPAARAGGGWRRPAEGCEAPCWCGGRAGRWPGAWGARRRGQGGGRAGRPPRQVWFLARGAVRALRGRGVRVAPPGGWCHTGRVVRAAPSTR